ncbi:MAG: hypothetical protein AAGC56_08535 [Pseudomonadota bacterium]
MRHADACDDHEAGKLSATASLFATQPAGGDRRITARLLNAWADAARGRFPSWRDMRRADLGPDWNWCFVVDLDAQAEFPHFVYLGQHLADLSEVYLSREAWSESLLDLAATEILSAVERGAPLTRDKELALPDGRRLAFRAIAAPLAEDGQHVSHVFGAATGRYLDF